jgi:cystathionine beta-lyase/cystathionine gamma-synthase
LDGVLSGGGQGGEKVRQVVQKVEHASLQKEDMEWLSKQMPNGFGPVFSVWMKSETLARRLPSKLEFFHHATSLGGVESLIEWRKMSDQTVEGTLLRISVGIENWEDLKRDLESGFEALAEEESKA